MTGAVDRAAIRRRKAAALTDVRGRRAWRTLMFWFAFAALVAIRIPSLAQPAGGDQGLYWYVGERIAHGEIPYRDAWDQKPPGIHFAYALLLWLWPHESVVPGADLVVAVLIGLLLFRIGRAAFSFAGAGETAALMFLALGNPVVTRLGGMRVRSQCETFIALAVTVALFALRHHYSDRPRPALTTDTWRFLAAGLAIGVAAVFKYNAIVYLAVPLLIWLLQNGVRRKSALAGVVVGCAIPAAAMIAYFGLQHAWSDLVAATVSYNLQYSGETYSGPAAFFSYLIAFPYRHAWIDSLWFLGGTACAVLVVAGLRSRRLLIAPAWVAAACLAIAVNGSRELQQYFVQAGPGLALAIGGASALVWGRVPMLARVLLVALAAIAVWRIADIPKGVDYTAYDWRGLTRALPREQYLARYGAEASGDKYSALAVERLAQYLAANTRGSDRVLVFGFSGAAYAKAHRASASRFFWSRPVIIEFNHGHEGYGPEGLLGELAARQPAAVVLQWRDWDPDTVDSATYFHRTTMLDSWLRGGYIERARLGNYEIWLKQSPNDGR